MIKKDKVYELKIEEDDEVSGIDSISLVDEPAIEINWMFFNKIKQEDFHIPDGEDQSYIDRLVQRAENEQDFFDEGWVVESVEQLNREDFVSTDPNGPSSLDEKEYKVRYKYMLNPDISGQSSIIPTTRDFCKELIRGNYVWRIEDMTAITNDEGDSAIRWRGGYNCRHVWSRIKYRNDARIINKASVNTGKELVNGFPNDLIPDEYIPGHVQSDTRTSNPSFSKEGFETGVPHYTKDGKLYEGPTHKDADGRLMTGAVHSEDSEYLYHEGEFAGQKVSFDYNTLTKLEGQLMAKRLIGNGYDVYIVTSKGPASSGEVNRIAERIGIPRNKVNLTDGKPIWITLKRLGITKHYDSDPNVIKDINKNAGNIQTIRFGYDNNLPSYVDEGIKKKKKKDQKFQVDDEKRIIVGPAMVPDLRIPRKDSEGNLYEVYFSSETIKMIAEKYMRNKYTDNNDLMHDGKAINDVYVIESWIKEDMEDKSNKYGYQDTPVGTWFVSMKCAKTPEGDKVWEMVKSGELAGFSVSGWFEEVASFCREEMFLYQVAEILKKY
jgi:hypothetical protein